MEKARRVTLAVRIGGQEATGIMPTLLEFGFTDNAHGKADEVQLVLHNRDGLWTGEHCPTKGTEMTATLICHDWEKPGQTLSLPCGRFRVDEVEFSGPPDKISIKAVSASLTSGLRDTSKTRAWEHTNLHAVAAQLAGENGLALLYEGAAHPLQRLDQRQESDLALLCRLAHERAMHCKVHDGKLVLRDAETAEGQGAMLSIPRTGAMYSPTRYSFRDASAGTRYTHAEVAYTDPKTGTTHTATATAQVGDGEGSKGLTLDQRVETSAEAIRLGRARLHNANAEERTASVECMGCPYLTAGGTVELLDFGKFSGRYFIRTATHRLAGGQAYTTALELTRGAPTSGGSASDEV